jgi:hypothetical protein
MAQNNNSSTVPKAQTVVMVAILALLSLIFRIKVPRLRLQFLILQDIA